jgi:hypothetical protein
MARLISAAIGLPLAAGLALLAQHARAGGGPLPPPIAATLGNTLHYHTVDGRFDMLLLTRRDGRYVARITVTGAPPARVQGRWHVAGGRICRTQTRPAPPPGRATICEPYAAYPAPGRDTTMLGGKMRLRLLAGDALPR